MASAFWAVVWAQRITNGFLQKKKKKKQHSIKALRVAQKYKKKILLNTISAWNYLIRLFIKYIV